MFRLPIKIPKYCIAIGSFAYDSDMTSDPSYLHYVIFRRELASEVRRLPTKVQVRVVQGVPATPVEILGRDWFLSLFLDATIPEVF